MGTILAFDVRGGNVSMGDVHGVVSLHEPRERGGFGCILGSEVFLVEHVKKGLTE